MLKKGQLDYPIITFFILVFGLILLAPIMLKIFINIRDPISNNFGNMSGQGGQLAQANFNSVINTGINFWDKIITAAFILAVLLLFVSAFLIDTHPFFIILYIALNLMLILFAPDIVDSLGNIYDNANFATEVAQLTFINYIRVHFGLILVAIMVITGIIIYGKVALFGSGGGRRA